MNSKTHRILPLTFLLFTLFCGCRRDSFTFVAIPDIQYETQKNPELLYNRMQWIVKEQKRLNIQFVMQVGDVQNFDTPEHSQLQNGRKGFDILFDNHIPYTLCVGNHDTHVLDLNCVIRLGNVRGNLRNTDLFNFFFPLNRFACLAGTFEDKKIDNAFHIFSAGGLDWLVINLELWPRKECIDWAGTVAAKYPLHNVIILTHSFLLKNDSLGQDSAYGDSSPQYLFDHLIKQYANIKMVFCGHTGTQGYRVDTGDHGNKIYEFLQCYHDTLNNPTRIVTINTKKNEIYSSMYMPNVGRNTCDSSAVTFTNVTWVIPAKQGSGIWFPQYIKKIAPQ